VGDRIVITALDVLEALIDATYTRETHAAPAAGKSGDRTQFCLLPLPLGAALRRCQWLCHVSIATDGRVGGPSMGAAGVAKRDGEKKPLRDLA
jgi:hypothetical protein